MPDSFRPLARQNLAALPRTKTLKYRPRPKISGQLLGLVAAGLAACGGTSGGADDAMPGTGGSSARGGTASAGRGGDSGSSGRSGGSATGGTGGTAGHVGEGGAGGAGTSGAGGAGGANTGAGGSDAHAGATNAGSAGTTLMPNGGAGAGMPSGGRGSGGRTSGGAAGQAGMSGVAGNAGITGGAGSGGGAPSVCDFASGLNIAWVKFANDVPNPDLNTFKTIFKNTHDAGGRVVRWWFHTNGTVTPGYDASGLAQKLQQSHVDGVKAILGAAHDAGVVLDISLWSFDMLQDNAGDAHTNNQKLLENDANRQAYIDNYLTPLVNAIKGTPGLYAWEIFNEPEGMSPMGWATYKTTMPAIQKTVNWLAAAIHSADPQALVTNGAQTFDYCSSKNNYYSDAALVQAGGKQNGTLDFYQVHYYAANGSANSCFTHPASYWNLDKKLVIGEFAAAATDGVAQNDLYTNIYAGGYDGAWAWSYDADFVWPAMQAPMQALFTAHADVGKCP